MDEEMLEPRRATTPSSKPAGARMEMPGCSLCMGNQARVDDNTTVFSTSTRNFNNRLGNGAQVYLGSAELAAVCALLGRIPTTAEYLAIAAAKIDPLAADLYRYLNFDQIEGFGDEGRVVSSAAGGQGAGGGLSLAAEHHAPTLFQPQKQRLTTSSIRRMLELHWLKVILALVITGLGAATAALLFKLGSMGWVACACACSPSAPTGCCCRPSAAAAA